MWACPNRITDQQERTEWKRKKKKRTSPISLPPLSPSYLHPPLQVKWNDLMWGPVGVGNGVGGWVREALSISEWRVWRVAGGDWDPRLSRCAPCIDSDLSSSPPCRATAHTFTQNTHLISSKCASQWNLCLHSSSCRFVTGPVGDWWSLLLTDGWLFPGVLSGSKCHLLKCLMGSLKGFLVVLILSDNKTECLYLLPV